MSSSGIFSQDLCRWRSSRKSRKTCKIKTLNLKLLKIESSSRRCSMIWISNGQREEIQNNVFQILNKLRTTRRNSRRHWTFLGPGSEKKWYGTLSEKLEGKLDSTATRLVKRFKESGHPVFKSISALSRGILKRKFNRDTIHFTADASNTELFFRTIHSAKQLRSTEQSPAGVKSLV